MTVWFERAAARGAAVRVWECGCAHLLLCDAALLAPAGCFGLGPTSLCTTALPAPLQLDGPALQSALAQQAGTEGQAGVSGSGSGSQPLVQLFAKDGGRWAKVAAGGSGSFRCPTAGVAERFVQVRCCCVCTLGVECQNCHPVAAAAAVLTRRWAARVPVLSCGMHCALPVPTLLLTHQLPPSAGRRQPLPACTGCRCHCALMARLPTAHPFAAQLLGQGRHQQVHDFEEHLEDIGLDWLNPTLLVGPA